MSVLAVLAAAALLLLAAVAAGLIGFAVLGALRALEGALVARPVPVPVLDAGDGRRRSTRRSPSTGALVDTTCRPGPTRL